MTTSAERSRRPPAADGPLPEKRRSRLNRRPVHVRALLEDREFIKVSSFLLPRAMKARVLDLMERLRQARTDRKLRAAPGQPLLPEMTDGELLRGIKWRIDTLPPGDAETVARYIRHVTRWHSERRKKAAQMRHRERGAPPDLR